MKDLSKIIREFEKLPYKRYERRSPKNDSTDSYFYLSRQLVKCMMISDALNLGSYAVRTEINGAKQIMILHICSTDNS